MIIFYDKTKDTKNKIHLVLIAFILFFTLYMLTTSPDATWGDSAKLAILSHNYSFTIDAGTHPLRTLIGTIFDILPIGGSIGYRQNILSAFFGALSTAMLLLLLLKITSSKSISIAITAFFGISHIHWHLSVISESYTLSLFIFLLMLNAIWEYTISNDNNFIFYFAFLSGLGAANFLFLCVFSFMFFLYLMIKKRAEFLKIKNVLIIIVLFCLGYMPVLIGIISRYNDYRGIKEIFYALFALKYSGYAMHFSILALLKGIAGYFIFLGYQFPSPIFILGFIGIYFILSRKNAFGIILLGYFLIIIFFTSVYMRQRSFFIMHSSFCIFAVFSGFAILHLSEKIKKAFLYLTVPFLILTISIYNFTPTILNKYNLAPIHIRQLPYRDNLSFYLTPWKFNDNGAVRYAEECFNTTPNNSIILGDFTPMAVLKYYVLDKNPGKDITLVPIHSSFKKLKLFLDENIKKHRIFLADDLETTFHIKQLRNAYTITPHGILFEISEK